MDATLKNDEHSEVVEGKSPGNRTTNVMEGKVIDITLQELCEYFNIHEVPDVASVNPQSYEANMKLLGELEQLTATL